MIKPLTSFRFFAAFGVFLHHLNYYHGLGSVGVSFFFVLSGFILTYTYHSKFNELSLDGYKKFMLFRVARVYPLHLLTFFLSLPTVYYFHLKYDWLDKLLNLLLLQSYFPRGNKVFTYNAVSWSISTEMFFYAMFPVLLFVLLKLIGKSNHTAKLLCFGLVVFAAAALIGYKFRYLNDLSLEWWFIYINPLFRLVDFSIGMVLCLLFFPVKDMFYSNLRNKILFTCLEIGSIVAFYYSYQSTLFKFVSYSYSLYYIPSICLILLVFAFQKGLLSDLLSLKPLVHLGEISYTMYMIHQLAIYYFTLFLFPKIQGHYSDIKLITAQIILLVFVICLSDFIYRYYELPMRTLIRKLTIRQRLETNVKTAEAT